MNNTGAADLSLWQMLLLYAFLLLPSTIMMHLKVPLVKKLWVSSVRMTVQLTLIGLYLGYLFKWNHWAVNLGWVLVMATVAASHILKSSGLSRKKLFTTVAGAVLFSLFTVLTPLMIGVVQAEPMYDARYLVPIGGMLLGNFLSANIIALSHYSNALRTRTQELQTAFCFGADLHEATKPYLKEAFQRALTPTVTMIGTLGLVSIPGMMTGQLLGGSFPLVAIKYQIAIMIAIVSAGSLSIFTTLYLITSKAFDERGNVTL